MPQGVILYVMVVGTFPFQGGSEAEIAEKIKYGVYQIPSRLLSHACVDLIRKILVPDHRARIRLSDMVKHSWLTEGQGLSALHSRDSALPTGVARSPSLPIPIKQPHLKSLSDTDLSIPDMMLIDVVQPVPMVEESKRRASIRVSLASA